MLYLNIYIPTALIIIFLSINVAFAQKINPQSSFFAQLPLKNINSHADEGNIYYDDDNHKLYFVRKYHEQNIGGVNDSGDIWYIKKNNDDTWGTVTNLGKGVNDKNENIIIGISDKGNVLWLYGQYDDEAKLKRKNSIFKYDISANKYTRQKVKYYHNISKAPGFFVNRKGNIMLLSINTFDSKGVEDLYVSFLEPENSKYNWSVPRNLGESINTKFQEKTPFLSSDNISLLYSSNGHPGNGSFDVFLSQRKDSGWNKWSKPYHLNDKINTLGVDNHFILLGKGEGIYSSTYDSFGYGDIRLINWKKDKVNMNTIVKDTLNNTTKTTLKPQNIKNKNADNLQIKGEIYDANTNKLLYAKIKMTMLNDSEHSKTLDFTTNKKGVFLIQLPNYKVKENDNEFVTLKVSADGYLSQIKRIKLSNHTINVNFKIDKLIQGATIQLKNVLFQSGTSKMLSESQEDIEQVAEAMTLNKKMTIELRGHTDGKDNEFNVRLSQNRVEAVKKILVGYGISHNRVIGKGFGSKQPLYNNEDKLNRKKNRRVEFKILYL